MAFCSPALKFPVCVLVIENAGAPVWLAMGKV